MLVLKVACILPTIPNDPEDEVSLEDEYSEELDNMADISKRGYKFKITDWASRTVNVHDALFEMTGAAGAPLQFEHVEIGESSTPNGESVIGKINKIVETMEKKFKLMKDRVCFLEEENMELKERVSELEGKQNLGTDFSTDKEIEQTLDETPSNPNGAEENLDDEVIFILDLNFGRETIGIDIIMNMFLQHTTDPLTEVISSIAAHYKNSDAEESSLPTLFEIGADVEIASNDDTTCRIWYQGMVVDQNLCDGVEKSTVEYSTLFADQKRVQDTVTTDRIRPPPPTTEQKAYQLYENVEGLYNNGWCSGQVRMTLQDNTYSVYLNSSMETINFEPFHLRIHREWTDGVWKTPDEMGPDYFKRLSETQSQKLSQQDHVMEEKPDKKRKANSTYLRRSERVPKRSRDTKTPFKSERNPALTVTREMIPEVDPFSTPAVHKVQRFQDCLMSKGGIHGHIEGAFAMLNCRIVDNPAWFHNYKIPKACFLPMTFLSTLGYYVDLIEKHKAEGKKIFADGQRELVRGEVYLHKKWGEDVEVLYGAITGRYGNHWIVLLPALMMEAFGKEVDKVVPYKIEKAEGIPKTHSSYKRGLFVLKMLECHSFKIENMSKINDANALELRRSLSCEIFNQFVDEK
ncbi:hypothetical protein Bca52824_016067 [Brassica carinata]|uniref:Agenet domain-containing protein n=1 Tax=Brassica carinata TaxID=52824 RepID=A0A8X8B3R1_BRACI|nr:hypothetical protein Bca52824_016067 [Brassica carinata]